MTENNKIRVLIIDDSLVFDRFLSEALPKASSNIEAAGYFMSPYDALTKIPVLTAAPQVPHKPQIPPGTCAPLFLISPRAASKSSSPPAFL